MPARAGSRNAKAVYIVVACLCAMARMVGGVYAYLTAKTDPLTNEFVPAKVSCSVEEQFSGGVKSNVKVRNTGNIDAYIRAVVVATFVSDDGKVLATAPVEGVDYEVTWATEGWAKGADGYWYHGKPVAPGETTAVLMGSASQISIPAGCRLHIQILATAIQSAPDEAVQDAWGVTVSNGTIVP